MSNTTFSNSLNEFQHITTALSDSFLLGMPTSHSCVRITSTELAQLQYSVQALGLQNECVIPKTHSSDAKENVPNLSYADRAPTDVLSLNISGSETLDIDLLSANELQDDDELEKLSALSTSGSGPFLFSGFSFEGLSNRPEWEDMDASASSSNSIDLPPLPPKFSRKTTAELKKHNERIPIRSLPMSREVSLYQGLPNGWQLNSDYDDAMEEFMHQRDDGILKDIKRQPGTVQNRKRPRIPSIAPLGSAKFNLTHVDGGGNGRAKASLFCSLVTK